MKNKTQITIPLPPVPLPAEVAYTLSGWLYGLAHEFDMAYQDEIRSHMEWLDEQRALQEDDDGDGDDNQGDLFWEEIEF